MDRPLAREAANLLADLRGTLVELEEEGVEAVAAAAEPAAEIVRQSTQQATPEPPQEVTRERDATQEPNPPIQPAVAAGTAPTLESVREELGECTRCGLCQGRKTIVFGSGNPNAELMFIGEGPGENEDRQGLPFVGRAGELLTSMIEKGLGIPRGDVYICNIVKCRPPQNRNPLPDEVAACRPFLDGQIRAVKPKVIVSLGKPAASLLLGRDVAITRVRGSWQSYHGIPLMPTLHPAFVLRQYTPENRRFVWEDLKAAQSRCSEG